MLRSRSQFPEAPIERRTREGDLNVMNKKLLLAVLLAGAAILLGVRSVSHATEPDNSNQLEKAASSPAPPLYRSSVVGTEIDFITEKDPGAFVRLDYVGFEEFEMPDKRSTGEPLIQIAYVFEAFFNDGTKVSVALDKEFGSKEAAEQDAMRYAPRLGKLPSLYRQNLKHIVVHKGGADTTAFAEDKGHFFVIYSENATKRIKTNDLEETFFHEGTHAAIQDDHIKGAAWRKATTSDNAYITEYAKTEDQEDFAESALFAYTLIHHPERFPAAEREQIEKQIPGRIAFFRSVYAGSASR